ncbi:MAG: ISAzo13 family transposase, partial [Deltaproteobacteria bacterium]|nr:ISAzo13 family transposase [Deltaproteobacteria bacterium]
MMETESALTKMFNNVWPHLGERERRLIAASEAKRIGRRGISMVSRACGLSRVTITKGIKELDEAPLEPGKTRRAGAGRPRVERVDPGIWSSLEDLLHETTKNETDPPLFWTIKSTRRLAQELTASHHRISHEKVAQILRKNNYNLMGTRKTDEKQIHPDRDAQFRHISRRVSFHLSANQPILAVETRKKDSLQDVDFQQEPKKEQSPIVLPDNLSKGAHPRGIYDPKLARRSAVIPTALEASTFSTD